MKIASSNMFTLLHRYVLKQFFITFASAICVFIGIFIIIRLMEQLNHFIRIADRTPFYKFILYFVYEIPFTFMYLVPMAVIFSTSFVLGKLSSNSELPIFKNAGQHILFYLYPIILSVLLYCITIHLFSETLIYKSYAKYNKLHREFRNSSDPKLKKTHNITQFGGEEVLYIIKEFDPKKKCLYNGNVIYLNKDYSLKKLVTFNSAIYNEKKGHWVGEEVTEKRIEKSFYREYAKKILEMKEKPRHFSKDTFKKEELSLSETKEIALKIEHVGGNANSWWTEYHFKIATFYIALIFVIIGIPLSGISRKSPFVSSFLFCLLFAIVYWVSFEVGRSLGHQKILVPIVAGWFANILYIGFIVILYQRKF